MAEPTSNHLSGCECAFKATKKERKQVKKASLKQSQFHSPENCSKNSLRIVGFSVCAKRSVVCRPQRRVHVFICTLHRSRVCLCFSFYFLFFLNATLLKSTLRCFIVSHGILLSTTTEDCLNDGRNGVKQTNDEENARKENSIRMEELLARSFSLLFLPLRFYSFFPRFSALSSMNLKTLLFVFLPCNERRSFIFPLFFCFKTFNSTGSYFVSFCNNIFTLCTFTHTKAEPRDAYI